MILNLTLCVDGTKSNPLLGNDINTIPNPISIIIRPTKYANDRFSIKLSKFKYIKLKANTLDTKKPVNFPNESTNVWYYCTLPYCFGLT